jgi:RNA polymerase sigma-70 factor (ECF subfamily)
MGLSMAGAPRDGGADASDLEARARGGDAHALAELFDLYRERLKRMIRLRLDRRLAGRVDPSDVLQEAYLDASRRLGEYARNAPTRPMPLFLWLRLLTGQRMVDVQRRHLGAKLRDAAQEVSLYRGALPEATTVCLAAQLLGRLTSPTHAALRAEMQLRLQEALNSMDPLDREVLVLRHFEELGNGETAEVLGITKTAASSRGSSTGRRRTSALSPRTTVSSPRPSAAGWCGCGHCRGRRRSRAPACRSPEETPSAASAPTAGTSCRLG